MSSEGAVVIIGDKVVNVVVVEMESVEEMVVNADAISSNTLGATEVVVIFDIIVVIGEEVVVVVSSVTIVVTSILSTDVGIVRLFVV